MSIVKGATDELRHTSALDLLGANIRAELDTILNAIVQKVDTPLRLHSARPDPDSKLYIKSSRLAQPDGSELSLIPSTEGTGDFPETNIDLLTGAIVGGTVTIEGQAFALPTSVIGEIRFLVLTRISNTGLGAFFSDPFPNIGAVTGIESSVNDIGGQPIGVVFLEATDEPNTAPATTAKYKTYGSPLEVIQTSTPQGPQITNFSSSGGGGSQGGVLQFAYVTNADSPVQGEIGKNYMVDTRGGPVIINQPLLADIPTSNELFAVMAVTDEYANFHINSCQVLVSNSVTETQRFQDGTTDDGTELDTQGIELAFYRSNDTTWYVSSNIPPSEDAGGTTSGEGGVNFFTNSRFTEDLGTDGWLTEGDFSSLSLESANPLEGDNSLRMTNNYLAVRGKLVGSLTTIAEAYRGLYKTLTGIVKITGPITSRYVARLFDNDVGAIVEGSETTLIANPNGHLNYIAVQGVNANTGNSFQFEIEDTGDGANGDVLLCDLLKLTPDGGGSLAHDSDWRPATPVVSGFGAATFSTNNAIIREDETDVLIIGTIRIGTAGSGTATFAITLPDNRQFDTSLLTDAIFNFGNDLGSATFTISGTTGEAQAEILPITATTFGFLDVGSGTLIRGSDLTAGTRIGYRLRVPNGNPVKSVRSSTDLQAAASYAEYATFPNMILSDSVYTIVKFVQVISDDNKDYDPATGVYVCPLSERYFVNVRIRFADISNNVFTGIAVKKNDANNNTTGVISWDFEDSSSGSYVSFKDYFYLKKGDTLAIAAYQDNTTNSTRTLIGSNAREARMVIGISPRNSTLLTGTPTSAFLDAVRRAMLPFMSQGTWSPAFGGTQLGIDTASGVFIEPKYFTFANRVIATISRIDNLSGVVTTDKYFTLVPNGLPGINILTIYSGAFYFSISGLRGAGGVTKSSSSNSDIFLTVYAPATGIMGASSIFLIYEMNQD